jgi:hypothetical protein
LYDIGYNTEEKVQIEAYQKEKAEEEVVFTLVLHRHGNNLKYGILRNI